MLNITTTDINNLEFVAGPSAYFPKEKLRAEEQAGGDIVEFTAALINKESRTHFLLKMFLCTEGEYANKLSIRVLDHLDAFFPTVGNYEQEILSFIEEISNYGGSDKKLYDVFRTPRYQKQFVNDFKLNKDNFKEHYGYELADDLEVVFYYC